MKKALALTVLSSALLVSFPAFAGDTIVKTDSTVAQVLADLPPEVSAAPAKAPSDMVEALTALGKELKAAIGTGRGNPIPHLDQLAAHEYSDATKQKIAKVFGDQQPLNIKRVTADGGQVSYLLTAPAHHYLDSNATTFDWSQLDLNLQLDKAGRNMLSKADWRSFSMADKNMTMVVSDAHADSKQRRNARNIWLGKVSADIGKMEFTSAGAPAAVLEDISFTSNTVEHGAAVDVGYNFGIKAIKAGGEQVDDVRYAMRLMNIDMRALEKMTDSLAAADQAGKTPAQQMTLMVDQFKLIAKSAAARGTALDIEDISAAFHGNRASIKGKVWLAPGSGNADFASMDKFGKKVIARLTVRVPVALVTDIARIVMAKQAGAKGEAASPEAVAQGAQSATDLVVGMLLNGGMAKLEDGVLVALIEYKGGKLTCNGKPVNLPNIPAKPAPAASAAP